MSSTLAGSVRQLHWHHPEWCAVGLAGVGWLGLLLLPGLTLPGWAALLAHAATMSAAMMVPLVLDQVHRVAVFSLWRRRYRASSVFLAAFTAVWTAASVVLMILERLLDRAIGPYLAVVAAFLLAVLVTRLPGRQRRLRLCGATRPLAPCGPRADRDAAAYGVQTGCHSVRSCWALMLAVTASQSLVITAAATVVAYLESRHPDRQGRWASLWLAQLGAGALVLAVLGAGHGVPGHPM